MGCQVGIPSSQAPPRWNSGIWRLAQALAAMHLVAERRLRLRSRGPHEHRHLDVAGCRSAIRKRSELVPEFKPPTLRDDLFDDEQQVDVTLWSVIRTQRQGAMQVRPDKTRRFQMCFCRVRHVEYVPANVVVQVIPRLPPAGTMRMVEVYLVESGRHGIWHRKRLRHIEEVGCLMEHSTKAGR